MSEITLKYKIFLKNNKMKFKVKKEKGEKNAK